SWGPARSPHTPPAGGPASRRSRRCPTRVSPVAGLGRSVLRAAGPSHEGGRCVSRLADVVQQDALDAPAGPAQRFLRAAAALAQAGIDGWRDDRAALEIRARAVALCQADASLAPLGFRALLMLIDEAVIQDRLS